jgi:hypothetical protein
MAAAVTADGTVAVERRTTLPTFANIAFDASQNMYLGQLFQPDVFVFSSTGAALPTITAKGPNIASDKTGTVWACTGTEFCKLNPPGVPVAVPSAAGYLDLLEGDGTGGVWATLGQDHNPSSGGSVPLVHVTASGTVSAVYRIGDGSCYALHVDDAGNAWIAVVNWGTKIYQVSPSGTILKTLDLGTAEANEFGFDGAGNLWALCSYEHVMRKYSPGGELLATYPNAMAGPMKVGLGKVWYIGIGGLHAITL